MSLILLVGFEVAFKGSIRFKGDKGFGISV